MSSKIRTEPFDVLDAKFLLAITPGGSAPESQVPEVAFAGRSNVGKSSLLNRMVNRRKLVRTSSTPGCTRQINVFSIQCADGLSLNLVDLPGFGFAKRSKDERAQWGVLIEHYLASRRSLALLVLVVDIRRGWEDEEQMLVEFIRSVRPNAPLPLLCAVTKTDKVPKPSVGRAVSSIALSAGIPAVAFSAVTGENRDKLWSAVRHILLPRQTSRNSSNDV